MDTAKQKREFNQICMDVGICSMVPCITESRHPRRLCTVACMARTSEMRGACIACNMDTVEAYNREENS